MLAVPHARRLAGCSGSQSSQPRSLAALQLAALSPRRLSGRFHCTPSCTPSKWKLGESVQVLRNKRFATIGFRSRPRAQGSACGDMGAAAPVRVTGGAIVRDPVMPTSLPACPHALSCHVPMRLGSCVRHACVTRARSALCASACPRLPACPRTPTHPPPREGPIRGVVIFILSHSSI